METQLQWDERQEDLFYEAFQMCRHLSAFYFTDSDAANEARAEMLSWLADTAAEAQTILSAAGDLNGTADQNEMAVTLRRRRMVAVCCAAAAELDAFVRGPVAGSAEEPVAFDANLSGAGLALANAVGIDGMAASTITPMAVARTIGYALHNLPSLVRSADECNPVWFEGDAADIRRAVAVDDTWAAAFARTIEAVDALARAGQNGDGGP